MGSLLHNMTSPKPAAGPLALPLLWARGLYSWVERLSARPAAVWLLALVAFIESVFFPVPPDAMLIPMGVARPRRALLYASVALLASVGGGIVGYYIGAYAWDTLGRPIVEFYGQTGRIDKLFAWYRDYDAWIVLIAGFTPIPYKLFTLTSGAAGVNLGVFLVASLAGRGARFFLVSSLLYVFGARAGAWIDRHFDRLTIVFVLLILLATLGLAL